MNQRQLFLRHVAQTSQTPMMGFDIDIVKASGCTLYARDGKTYLDMISGISVSSLGHCHPVVVRAIKEQSEKFMHLMVFGEFDQSPQVAYATALAAHLPASLQSVFFTTGGSEAVEGAVKLAKRATGRTEIVSFVNAYHGSTQGALSLMGDETLKQPYRPLIPGNVNLQFNEPAVIGEISSRTAAVIVEPVQGEAGIRCADKSFLEALAARCRQKGALLIFDEVQTGFGRTGLLFAMHRYRITPDVLVIGKGMGGGMPIGAFISSRELMGKLASDPPLGHINTFGGNAVCVAAAHATLQFMADNRLWERAVVISTVLKEKLRHPAIKELRVCGALAAIEFGSEELNMEVNRQCISRGLITDWFLFCPTAMRIAPPLVITDEELDQAIHTILEAVDEAVSKVHH